MFHDAVQLLSEFTFLLFCHCSLSVMQANPKLEAAVHLHGGTISQQDIGSRCCVLVATDMQKAGLSSVPPNAAKLYRTTVDHMLVSLLCDVLRTCITSCKLFVKLLFSGHQPKLCVILLSWLLAA